MRDVISQNSYARNNIKLSTQQPDITMRDVISQNSYAREITNN